ncbi:MAG: SDR family oxidoreductase [Gemmatimonadetes bacterium]|nr:MAG: SDR family oxidoreductase [Gemmatimonadota bacterium]
MQQLSNKVALITGAGGAVGSGVTTALHKAGCKLVLVELNDTRLMQLRQQFAGSDDILPLPADLGDPEAVQRLVDSATRTFGRVDFLFNAVGGWVGGKRLHEHTLDDLQKMLRIDLIPTFNIMNKILPVMVDQGGGKIINFASMAVFGTGANVSAYAASKSGIVALTRAAAEEYKTHNIQVHAFAPSIIDTPANRAAMPGADFSQWVSIAELAQTAVFIFSSANSLSSTIFKFTGRL